jgi:[ribosomal protein S5]-alanine N-acetyltransferase
VRAASPSLDPWTWGFAIIDRESELVIGSVGFKGPPDQDGLVEIAYGIVQDFQGRGMATEAASVGLAFASAHGARRIRAHTRPMTNPSTRVLEKCGFTFVGEVDDPEDGPVWRWEREGADRG